MAEYLSPGVYVQEVSSGIKPIEGVGTSTAAFAGIAEKGPVDEPVLITNFTEFVTTFGSFYDAGYLAVSVYQFFQEGGTKCYVVRTVAHDNTGSKLSKPADALEAAGNTIKYFYKTEFKAKYDGTWANPSTEDDKDVNGLEIDIKWATNGLASDGYFQIAVYHKLDAKGKNREIVEVFDELTEKTMKNTVNAKSKYIIAEELEADPADADNAEAGDLKNEDGEEVVVNIKFDGGEDGLYKDDGSGDFLITSGDFKKCIDAFDIIDEINNLCMPDASLANDDGKTISEIVSDISNYGMTYCENRGDCFFIADPPYVGMTASDIKEYKEGKNTMGDDFSPLNSTYGALYFPWLLIPSPVSSSSDTLTIPPCGSIAGIYARTDSKVGVHKAPAGHATGKLNSVSGVDVTITKAHQEILNPNGINAIRPFPNSGIIVWGARTTTSDSEWKYINVRRLFLMVEESIDEGTQWVVFEPNSPELWGKVKRNLVAFLTTVWRSGALFGSTPDEAFYVKVDSENNPSSERDLGRLNIEVGIAPVKPAEFVIIKISQKTLST